MDELTKEQYELIDDVIDEFTYGSGPFANGKLFYQLSLAVCELSTVLFDEQLKDICVELVTALLPLLEKSAGKEFPVEPWLINEVAWHMVSSLSDFDGYEEDAWKKKKFQGKVSWNISHDDD